jgi:hypothetical protein
MQRMPYRHNQIAAIPRTSVPGLGARVGRRAFCLLAALALAAVLLRPAAASPPVPADPEMQDLVQRYLQAFSDGVKKRDMTGFYNSMHPLWRSRFTLQQTSDLAKTFLKKRIVFGKDIAGKKATFNKPPAVAPDGRLIADGYFRNRRGTITFVLKFSADADEWKLTGFDINTK